MWDQRVNLTGFLDSLHMVSHYFPIYLKALKELMEKIQAKKQQISAKL